MPRPPSNRTTEAPLLKYKTRRKNKSKCLIKCCIISIITILILLLIAFIVIFVVIPLIFKYSIELQRDLIFPIYDHTAENADFINFTKHEIYGARNLFIVVNKTGSIALGVWHLLPTALINNSIDYPNFNYTESLAESEYPVVIHFHGNGGNRIANIDMYQVLREFYHVIAFDYRCYGDSTCGELTEETVVQDSMELYKWLNTQTTSDIYVWGHSLGAAIGIHTLARLKGENVTATGVFLEAPFTTLRDEVKYVETLFWFTRVFLWLPWYEATLVDPFEAHGFAFKTTEHILKVDCPIKIFHAEDDNIIPIKLGRKLYKVAISNRNYSSQGNVSFRAIPALGFDHWQIYLYQKLPVYINTHIDVCKMFKKELNDVM